MKPRKGDFVLLLIMGLIALWSVGLERPVSAHPMAVVTRDGQEILRLDLSKVAEPQDYDFGTNIIRVEPGRIGFVEADCQDQICVRTGMIGRAGQSAACLPNRILIKIEGQGEEDVIIG